MLIFKTLNKGLLVLTITANLIAASAIAAPTAAPTASSAAQNSLQALIEGNKRYVAGKSTCGWTANPSDEERRKQLAVTQKPFAIILGCSDSRVPPEIIFDQRLGSLFVVRVAGNIVDDVVLGSIEFAARFLGQPTPLIFVLGHERCGAVVATIDAAANIKKTPTPDNHISSIVKRIMPVVLAQEKLKNKNNEKNFVSDVINANVKSIVAQLKSSSPVLADAVKKNELNIVGGSYDLDTGKVTVFE